MHIGPRSETRHTMRLMFTGNRRVLSFRPVSRSNTIQRLKVDWMASLDSSTNRYTPIVPVNLNSGHNRSNETHHYCLIPLPSAFSNVPLLSPPFSVHTDKLESMVSERRPEHDVPDVPIDSARINHEIYAGHRQNGVRLIVKFATRTVAITDFHPSGDALTSEQTYNVQLTRWSITLIWSMLIMFYTETPRPCISLPISDCLCNVVLIACDQSLITSAVNNRWHYRNGRHLYCICTRLTDKKSRSLEESVCTFMLAMIRCNNGETSCSKNSQASPSCPAIVYGYVNTKVASLCHS